MKLNYLDVPEYVEQKDAENERNETNAFQVEDHRPDSSKVQYIEGIPDFSNRQTTNTLSKLGNLTFHIYYLKNNILLNFSSSHDLIR